VRERYSIEPVGLRKRVLGALGAVVVELFFKQCVNGAVEVKGKAGRPGYTELIVDVETARALHEEVDLRARQRPLTAAVAVVRVTVWFIVLAHESLLYLR
jgi:hypothetical protein